MTFICPDPLECGIVELDHDGIVVDFHEKVKSPPSKLANAAVYLIEPEVVKWISDHPKVNDFSTEVLPSFLGKIATWNNQEVHRDIGTIKMLKEAQTDKCEGLVWNNNSSWQKNFLNNPIHKLINI